MKGSTTRIKSIFTNTFKYALLIPMVLISIGLIGCNDDNNSILSSPTPTPSPTLLPNCVAASSNPEFLEDHIECPADALIQMCNTFSGSLFKSDPNSSDFNASFLAYTCSRSSCFDFTCDVGLKDKNDPANTEPGIGKFNIETVTGNTISGIVLMTYDESLLDTEIDYVFTPPIP